MTNRTLAKYTIQCSVMRMGMRESSVWSYERRSCRAFTIMSMFYVERACNLDLDVHS